jgi:hypothetical protein
LHRPLTDLSRRDGDEGGTLALVEEDACMYYSSTDSDHLDQDASVTAAQIAGMA